jgi:hypothetical protein
MVPLLLWAAFPTQLQTAAVMSDITQLLVAAAASTVCNAVLVAMMLSMALLPLLLLLLSYIHHSDTLDSQYTF